MGQWYLKFITNKYPRCVSKVTNRIFDGTEPGFHVLLILTAQEIISIARLKAQAERMALNSLDGMYLGSF